MKKFVKSDIFNNIGVITLNRGKKLNSLSYRMLLEIRESLLNFEKNGSVKLIILKGSGNSFCAGGDLFEIYEKIVEKDNPEEFFKLEFEVDDILDNLKTPVISFWQGMTMGGGVGLSMGSDIKVADETTRWAMPETRLGMIPDVGVGYYFSKLERPLALYLSLLGKTINAGDLLGMDFADFAVLRSKFDSIVKDMVYTDFSKLERDGTIKKAESIISKYEIQINPSLDYENIYRHFDKNSVLDILDSLEMDKSKWAVDVRDELLKKCPFSLVTVFYKYEYGKKWTRKYTYKKDLDIISYSIKMGNVKEGIKSVMIDKDRKPQFNPEHIEDVDIDSVKCLLEK